MFKHEDVKGSIAQDRWLKEYYTENQSSGYQTLSVDLTSSWEKFVACSFVEYSSRAALVYNRDKLQWTPMV